jgi:hypothetical protein
LLILGAFFALCAAAPSNNGFRFYADDVVVFLSPVVLDLVMIRAILDLFRQASGLATNINKIKAFSIRCDGNS